MTKNAVIILRLSDWDKTAYSDAATRQRFTLSEWLRAAADNRLTNQLKGEKQDAARTRKHARRP